MSRTTRHSRWWYKWWPQDKAKLTRDGFLASEWHETITHDTIWGRSRKKDSKNRKNRAIRRQPCDDD